MTTIEAGTTQLTKDQGPTLGEAVKAARRRIGMSQEQLAEAAGVSNAYVSLIENGLRGKDRGVSRDIVLRLADALGESKSQFLTIVGLPVDGEDEQSVTVEDAIKADGMLRSDQKKLLLGMYREMVGKR